MLTLKATTSLFARLLVIARSSRESVDLEEVIGMHEFAYTNKVLMAPDGSIHPSTDKSIVIKLLEDLVVNETCQTSAQSTEREEGSETCLVVEGMGVVQELMAVQNGKTCKELATSYIALIDLKARGYCQVRVIYTIIRLKSVSQATFADCRSQFLLDRLGRCLKLIVSYRGTSSHEFASQFGLAFFYT